MPVHPLLAGIRLTGCTGLEIGALHHPLVDRSDAQVLYVDHASTDDLRAKYAGDSEVGDIVDVDLVWGSEPLRLGLDRVLGPGELVDFVVASHVIEHVPDVVGWLAELAAVLRPGGVIALAVPDKRFCFDARRRTTDVADLVDAHLSARTRPTLAATFDFWTRYDDAVDTAALWAGAPYPPPTPLRDREALERTRAAAASPDFRDVHCWVFTPRTYLDALRRLADLDLLPELVLRWFRSTAPGHLEFYAVLERPTGQLAAGELRRRQLASIDAALQDAPAEETPEAGPADEPFRASVREQRAILAKRRLVEGVRRRLHR